MAERIDGVLVCGAGPVGLVTALKIARAGIGVLVVDEAPEIIQQPRAVVYHTPVVERLAELGLLPDLQAIGVLKQAYHYWNLRHELFAHISMDVLHPEDTPYPYNLHVAQPLLAATILQHFLRIAGAEVRWRHRVTALTQSADGVDVMLETPAGPTQLSAAWVVGADGGHSGVRTALGLTLEGMTWPEWFVATNVRFPFEAHGFGLSNVVIDPDHWAIIPKIDRSGLWRCTYREQPGLSIEEVRQRLPERYELFAPGLGGVVPEAVSPYRVHDRCAERFRVGRALLAGDAAHVVNPIGGLGLTGGLLDAVPLADALIAVIHGTRGEQVLDAYAQERRRVYLEVTAPTAKENRRRASERDPERHRADVQRLTRLAQHPELAREALLGVYQLVGRDPLALAS